MELCLFIIFPNQESTLQFWWEHLSINNNTHLMQPFITLHFSTPKLKDFQFVFLFFYFSFFPGKFLNLINNNWKQIITIYLPVKIIVKMSRSVGTPTLQFSSKPLFLLASDQIRSDQFSCSVVSDSMRPHESQHTRPPCLSPTPGVHSDSIPSSWWCHPAISSPVVPFSSCPQSLPKSESFPMSQLFTWGGQSTGLSALASFLPTGT